MEREPKRRQADGERTTQLQFVIPLPEACASPELQSPTSSGGQEHRDIKAIQVNPSDYAEDIVLPKPMFSKAWQFEETFSSPGGILQGCDSDVVLSIPTDAVDECQPRQSPSSSDSSYKQSGITGLRVQHDQPRQTSGIQILGAICTNLWTVHEQLRLEENEKICSPVAEYFAGKDFRFQKPVCIFLPHFLPKDIHETEIRVYQIQGEDGREMRISTVQLLQKDEDFKSLSAEGFCLKNGQICIFTTHFSAWCCTTIEKTPPNLQLRLYASYFQRKADTDIYVTLLIWDKRLNISDFRKASHIQC
jgi:hypothetical protein